MTADDIAMAVAAASKIVGADPFDVVGGKNDRMSGRDGDYKIARARAYAADALYEMFFGNSDNDLGGPDYARLVGVSASSRDCYVSNLKIKKTNDWWDVEVAAAVRSSVLTGKMPEDYSIVLWRDRQRLRMEHRATIWRKRGVGRLRPDLAAYRTKSAPPPEPAESVKPLPIIEIVEEVIKSKGTLTDFQRRIREGVPLKVTHLNQRRPVVLGKNVSAEILGTKS